MKLFDYKFLILLGLTIVVYFMYREINMINSRVYKLEEQSKNLSLEKQENKLELKPEIKQEIKLETKPEIKPESKLVFQIPLPPAPQKFNIEDFFPSPPPLNRTSQSFILRPSEMSESKTIEIYSNESSMQASVVLE
jgi:hypothetical protein